MSRFRPAVPPIAPYTGSLEPEEPDDPKEPRSTRMKVDAFINAIRGYEYDDKSMAFMKDVGYKPMNFKNRGI